MKYVIRLLAAVGTVVFLAVGAVSPSLAATSLPRINTLGIGTWSDGIWSVRPHLVAFGANFEIKRLYYQHYNQTDAYGHGRLVLTTCRPNCNEGAYTVRASAYFYGTRHHVGIGPYYGHLRLRWRHNHKSHSMLLWIGKRGRWDWRG